MCNLYGDHVHSCLVFVSVAAISHEYVSYTVMNHTQEPRDLDRSCPTTTCETHPLAAIVWVSNVHFAALKSGDSKRMMAYMLEVFARDETSFGVGLTPGEDTISIAAKTVRVNNEPFTPTECPRHIF